MRDLDLTSLLVAFFAGSLLLLSVYLAGKRRMWSISSKKSAIVTGGLIGISIQIILRFTGVS